MHPDLVSQINNSFQGHQARALRGLAGTQYAVLPANVAITSASSATLFSMPVNGGIWYHAQISIITSASSSDSVQFGMELGSTAEVESAAGFTESVLADNTFDVNRVSLSTGSLPISADLSLDLLKLSADLMVKFYEPGLAGLSQFTVTGTADTVTLFAGSYMTLTPTVPLFDK